MTLLFLQPMKKINQLDSLYRKQGLWIGYWGYGNFLNGDLINYVINFNFKIKNLYANDLFYHRIF